MATPSLFSVDDSSSPTAALPTLEQATSSSSLSSSSTSTLDFGDASFTTSSSDATSEYLAPLSGHAPDPSIDGTSVGGTSEEGGVRAESRDQVGDQEKQVRLHDLSVYGMSFHSQSLVIERKPLVGQAIEEVNELNF